MKYKKMIALAALIIALVGCGSAAAVCAQSTQNNEFKMELVAFDGDFDVYQDRETGVQYIVYREWKNAYATFCAMTPRYNSDGTLYCGEVGNP